MNQIERSYVVPQPLHVNGANSDRRRKPRDGRAFEIEPASADTEPAAPAAPLVSSGGDEGVGEFVNIVV